MPTVDWTKNYESDDGEEDEEDDDDGKKKRKERKNQKQKDFFRSRALNDDATDQITDAVISTRKSRTRSVKWFSKRIVDRLTATL